MNEMSFFRHHRINDHIYLVRESFGYDDNLPNSYFFIGVVIGGEKVAVIDAGNGATGGLRGYIEQKITGKRPMINLLTHNHLDHIGACMMFDERYLHRDDIDEGEIAWATNLDRHFFSDQSDLAAFCQNNREILDYCRAHYYRRRPTADDFIPIEDGDVFDLGGVEIEVLHMPTHSKGSCAFYVRQDHVAFTGDAVSPSGSGISAERVDGVSVTVRNYMRARDRWAPDLLICGGHHMIWGMDLLDKLIDSSAEIEEGANTANDIVVGRSPFAYKDETRRRVRPKGVMTLRHFHKDINQSYQVKRL